MERKPVSLVIPPNAHQQSYDSNKNHSKSLFPSKWVIFSRRKVVKRILAFIIGILLLAVSIFRLHRSIISTIANEGNDNISSIIQDDATGSEGICRLLWQTKDDASSKEVIVASPRHHHATIIRQNNLECNESPAFRRNDNMPDDIRHRWDYRSCTLKVPLKDYISWYRNELKCISGTNNNGGDSISFILKPSRTLWQTWKNHTFPRFIDFYWQRVMESNPDRTRQVLVDSEIDSYVQTHCSGPYWEMYKQTNPSIHALRADLWRYCALFTHGGIYMDADSCVKFPKEKLSSWIGSDAVLTQGGNHWDVVIADCSKIWKAVNVSFPSRIMTKNSLAQWAMVFPRPRHPIIRETMKLATEMISKWADHPNNTFPMKTRVICLSGPAMYTVAADRVYRANNNSWDGLGVTLTDGYDYKGKLQYKKTVFLPYLFDDLKRYDKMEVGVPLKIHA